MNETSSFIKEIGRSYIVSSFLPSIFFVLINLVLFKGFVPLSVKQALHSSSITGLQWLLILFLVAWLAFFLFSSVDWVVKIFEGYYFPKFLYRRMANSFAKKRYKDARFYPWINELVRRRNAQSDAQQALNPREGDVFFRNYFAALSEIQDLELYGKLADNNFLPTLLGNILRSSELYAYERYLIEGITIWPRLFPTLPRSLVNDMEEKKNHLMFLLNSALLTHIGGILSLVAGLISLFLPGLDAFKFIPPWLYFGFAISSPVFGYILYRIAVNASIDHVLFIRVAFDLYRKNLIRQLNYELPLTLDDERNLWMEITEYLIAGSSLSIGRAPILQRPYYFEKSNDEKPPAG